jgi:hypothetical protein
MRLLAILSREFSFVDGRVQCADRKLSLWLNGLLTAEDFRRQERDH